MVHYNSINIKLFVCIAALYSVQNVADLVKHKEVHSFII